MKKFFYLLPLLGLLLACSKENNVSGDIVGTWTYTDGSVFVDGVVVPAEDGEAFIDFETTVFTFKADGTFEYTCHDFGDRVISGEYSLNKKTRRLVMTSQDGDRSETIELNVKRLTDTELYLQQIEEDINIEYKDGEWNYQAPETHNLLIEYRFARK